MGAYMTIQFGKRDAFGSCDVSENGEKIGSITNEPIPSPIPGANGIPVFVGRNSRSAETREFDSLDKAMDWFRGNPPLISN